MGKQMELFTKTDWTIFVILFGISIVYAIILEFWFRTWPETFEELVWLLVVIGDGYVILALAQIVPVEFWLKICGAFFFASLPIIARSIIDVSRRRRDTNSHLEKYNDDGNS